MLDLSKFGRRPDIAVVGIISHVGKIKEVSTKNGTFYVQELAIEIFYGAKEKPFTETIAFQANSRPTKGFNKTLQVYEERPSFLEQFKTNPLNVGDTVSIVLSASGYVKNKGEDSYTVPKITLEKMYRLSGIDKDLVTQLVATAKANRDS